MTPAERLAAATRELPRGWSVRTLDEAASWYSGGTPSKAVRQYWDGPIPWVSPKDMKAFELHDVADHVSEAAAEHGPRVVPANTIFVVVRGMILAHTFPVSIAGRAMAFNQDVKGVVAKPDVHPRFLGHWFVASSHELLRLATASTHGTKKIDLLDLLRFPLRLPPPGEQRGIAEILDAADEAIAKTDAVIAKLQVERIGLARDVLRQDQEGPRPNGWERKTLADLLRGEGLLQTGPFGSQLHAADYVEHGIPVVMPQDIANAEITVAQIARITELRARDLARHALVPGDVVFARRGDLTRAAAISQREGGWLCGTGCLLLRPPRRTLLGDWVAMAYTQDAIQRQVAARAVGSTMVNLNTSILGSLSFWVPPLEDQRVAVQALRAVDERVRSENVNLGKLKLEKQGLMHDLLTGRVRVNA